MNIAKYNAQLTATAAGFSSTFASAGSTVKSFGSTVAGVASGLAVYDIAKGAISGIYANTVGLVKSQMEAIDATAKLSDTLGIETAELSRLQYAASYAGASNEDLAGGLAKMNRNLAEAATGSGPAADAMTALGLNAQQLLNTPADQRIGLIADALNGVANPAQRAALAQDVFGKGAVGLMPLLSEGSAGLKRYGEEADKLGYSFDRVDAAQIEMANDAIQKVKNVLVAVGTQLAIKLAPFIQTVADKLSGLALQGDGMAAAVVNGFEMVVTAVAGAADYLNLLEAGWHLLRAGAAAALVGILTPLSLVIEGIDWLNQKLRGAEPSAWAAGFKGAVEGMRDTAKEAFAQAGESFDAFASGENSAKVAKFFEGIRADAKATAEETAKAKQAFGGYADLDGEGGDDAGKRAADEAKRAHEDAARAAQQYYDATRTPAEKYAAEIERINELLMAGHLDSETAQRAADAAAKSYADATKQDEPKAEAKGGGPNEGAKLLQAGSQEAAQFVASIARQQAEDKAQRATARNTERTAKAVEQLAKRQTSTSSGDTINVVTFA